MSEIRVKRGETLNLSMQFNFDVSHAVLSAQVRDAQDCLIDTLPLVKQAQTGLVTVSAVDTTRYPVGKLRCDLKVTIGGQSIHSETFAINVVRSVTRP